MRPKPLQEVQAQLLLWVEESKWKALCPAGPAVFTISRRSPAALIKTKAVVFCCVLRASAELLSWVLN